MHLSSLPPAATCPGYCPVCRDIVSVADELNCCHPHCAWNGQAAVCTPPVDQASADSVPAPAVAGGGECPSLVVWWSVRYRDLAGRVHLARFSEPAAALNFGLSLRKRGCPAEFVPEGVTL